MRRNIHAYTEPSHPYPPYISVNHEIDGTISFIVRSPPDAQGRCGDTSHINLTAEQVAALAADLKPADIEDEGHGIWAICALAVVLHLFTGNLFSALTILVLMLLVA